MSDAPAETQAVEETPAVEEAPAVPEKKEPFHLKTWKAAEKPAYEKMPPNTPRKPIDKDVEKETELSKDQLKSESLPQCVTELVFNCHFQSLRTPLKSLTAKTKVPFPSMSSRSF